MIRHYLRLALRQILRNKVQYLLSVVSIAIGMLCFSMTSYYIRKNNNQYTAWPNKNRIAQIHVKSIQTGQSSNYVPGKELQSLLSNPAAGIERISLFESWGQANITFSKDSGKEEPYQCSFCNITPDFLPIHSMETTGGDAPSLRQGEVLISQSAAQRIYGTESPIGRIVAFSRADSDTSAIEYSTIRAIVKDLPDGTKERQDLYFYHQSTIHPDRNYWNTATLLLAEGMSSREINQRLKKQIPPFGQNKDNYLAVETYQETILAPENLLATLLIPLIGMLILVAAVINFLKFCIQTFYNRTRELSLRKSLGSGQAGLFALLFSEIALLLIFAGLTSLVLTELFIPFYYQILPDTMRQDEITRIDSQILIRQQVDYLIALFILCTGICALAIFRIKRMNLIQGVMGGNRQKHGIRNFMLGFQIFICILFIGGALGLSMLRGQIAEFRYNTLSEEACERIWKVNLWEPQLQGYEEEIATRIRGLAGVEDILFHTNGQDCEYKTPQGNTIRCGIFPVSNNYPEFMNLPIQGRIPQNKNEILASRQLIWQLEKDGLPDKSVTLDDKTYQITGIYEQRPFNTILNREQANRVNAYFHFDAISIPESIARKEFYVKCAPPQEEAIKQGILRIVRERLPESIPFELTTLQDENFMQYGGVDMLGDLFTLLAVISLLITALGIYSAITLDTQSRQKEVAIRKINGAGAKVIALLFGKLYIRLLVIASIPAMSIAYLLLYTLSQSDPIAFAGRIINNPLLWLSVLLVAGTVIFITVAYRIWLVSQLNPADVIKSE